MADFEEDSALIFVNNCVIINALFKDFEAEKVLADCVIFPST